MAWARYLERHQGSEMNSSCTTDAFPNGNPSFAYMHGADHVQSGGWHW